MFLLILEDFFRVTRALGSVRRVSTLKHFLHRTELRKPVREGSEDVFAGHVFWDWWLVRVSLDPASDLYSCLPPFPPSRVSGAGKSDYLEGARADLPPQ